MNPLFVASIFFSHCPLILKHTELFFFIFSASKCNGIIFFSRFNSVIKREYNTKNVCWICSWKKNKSKILRIFCWRVWNELLKLGFLRYLLSNNDFTFTVICSLVYGRKFSIHFQQSTILIIESILSTLSLDFIQKEFHIGVSWKCFSLSHFFYKSQCDWPFSSTATIYIVQLTRYHKCYTITIQ